MSNTGGSYLFITSTDPEPPVGTVLEVGGRREWLQFQHRADGWWRTDHGNPHTARQVDYEHVRYWAPLRVSYQPRPAGSTT